ncbi:MAG: hypothetical protein OXN90_15600 [Gemmatimonadota bacterium]|nr:hypothetical protein [Gemmatimonadota bacterium]
MNMTTGSWEIDKVRIVLLILAFIVAVVGAIYCQPLLKENWEVIRMMIMVFSILAGFLIVAMTAIVDSVLKEKTTWSHLVFARATVNDRLVRYAMMFLFYIATLVLALGVQITKHLQCDWVEYLQMVFLTSSIFMLLLSCGLPFTMIRIQRERYETALDAERPKNIKDALN